MSELEVLLARIEAAPEGPSVGAFFDFDGTLIDGYSASAFFKHRLKTGDIGFRELMRTVSEGINIERRGRDVSELMRIGVSAQAGRTRDDMRRYSREIFEKAIAGMVFPQARVIIDAHRRRGHTVVIASSATTPQIQPAAQDLGVRNIVCTQMEIDEDGRYTGALASPIRWGTEKAAGVAGFAADQGIDLAESFGYANGKEDIEFLELLGNPCALNPDKELLAYARGHGWPVARLVRPPKTDAVDVLRSGAALSVFGASVLAAAGLGLVNGSRTWGANLAAGAGADLSLAAAGVKLNVVGEENAWAQRPAVFLFNHQSQLDIFVLGAVLRKNFTGVAKKSLERDPLFAPIGWLADVAYIDRANNAKAREGLEPAVAALKGGRSIAIAPEGTRSPTPRLLPFKKGPFHLAMQAGVPVVPLIMRNGGELMAAHSFVIHPGVLDVAVLPPIPTEGWTAADLDDRIAGVRQQFLDTLSDWPTGP
jgi:putative phosphoserine phosphatase/1-acylglycerol-3-phosphate O-acyltransferase